MAALPDVRPGLPAIEYVRLELLRPAPYHPRTWTASDQDKLQRSIEQFGFVVLLVARRSDRQVIGGHLRLEVARTLGLEEAPVIFVDNLSDEDVRVLNLALNKISGSWDPSKLGALLLELTALPSLDLSTSGFDMAEVAQTVSRYLRELPGRSDEDDAPPVAGETIVTPGDRWLLGDHVIACGDAAAATVVPRETNRRPLD